jgi:hypothetical protein
MVEPIKRFLPLACESLLGPGDIVIELQQAVVANMALEITLLMSGSTESLRLQPSRGPAVYLRLTAEGPVGKAAVARAPDGSVMFTLGRNQAEFLHAVLLRAYRDQIAEVNHVHVEGDCGGSPFDLTIMFDKSREPISAEQAAKLMAD